MLLLVFTFITVCVYFCKACFNVTHILDNVKKHNTHKAYVAACSEAACCILHERVGNSPPAVRV